jgi:phosphate acyltransferase
LSINNSTSTGLPVAVDVMGGDLGSAVAVRGAVAAAHELAISSVLVGNEAEIKTELVKLSADNNRLLSVCHADEFIEMHDSPSLAIRGKEKASVRKAFELVESGKASSVVSPGNTGAFMAAGVYVSGTISGIARPAIASLIPNIGANKPTILLDCGANIDCNTQQLVQFAMMGNYYAKSVLQCESPRVALLSNGSEQSKGNDIVRSTSLILSSMKSLNYIGFIEGRDIGRGVVDVIVCDGFVGNIVLKTLEGGASLVFDSIKYASQNNLLGRIGMSLAKPMLKALFKERLDPSYYGGAPLLGLNQVAIVCHGSSNETAIMNAIRVADKFVKENMVSNIAGALGALEMELSAGIEDGLWGRMGQRFEKKRQVSRKL